MSQKTYGELKTFVYNKLDLQEENFITASEFLSYVEEALNFCEAEVHKLNIEDQYFEACANIRLVQGRSTYSLPSNIYANKVTRLVYTNGVDVYPINRLKTRRRYEKAQEIATSYTGTEFYEYQLVNNDVTVGTQVLLTHPASETSSQVTPTANTTSGSRTVSSVSSTTGISVGDFVSGTGIALNSRVESIDSSTQITLSAPAKATGTTVTLTITASRVLCWYIRRVNIPTATTDVIDFPEFWNFVAQHAIVECLKKELGNPRLQSEMDKLKDMREQVLETLANMVPDQEDLIEKDMSAYSDQGVEELFGYGV